jgi:hypothetical protein
MDWTDKLNDIKREIAKLKRLMAEDTARIDELEDDFKERTCQVEELFYVMDEIVEVHRAIVGRTPLVVWAEDRLLDVVASGFFDPTLKQEREQIDLWIETVGTAPPVDANVWGDVLEKRPLPKLPPPKKPAGG